MTAEAAPVSTVVSRDGTSIAFERSGQGPPVILVGGAFNDRSIPALRRLAALLAPEFTVFNYDRRGHGDSGDTAPYAVGREVEDLEALVAEAGGSASVYGLSSGAILALEAAARGVAVTRLALFEPPLPSGSPEFVTRLAELTSAGRRGEAVELFMTAAVGLSADTVAEVRATPMWPALEAVAHTLVYDASIATDRSLWTERAPAVTVPALVIDSAGSPAWLRESARAAADALPGARPRTLDGEFHEVPPETLAPVLAEFLAGSRPG